MVQLETHHCGRKKRRLAAQCGNIPAARLRCFRPVINDEKGVKLHKIYGEAIASAYKIYEKTSAYKIYQESTTSAYKIYQESTASASKIYDELHNLEWSNHYWDGLKVEGT